MNQAEVIRCGGVDAAMYMNILQMGVNEMGAGEVVWREPGVRIFGSRKRIPDAAKRMQ